MCPLPSQGPPQPTSQPPTANGWQCTYSIRRCRAAEQRKRRSQPRRGDFSTKEEDCCLNMLSVCGSTVNKCDKLLLPSSEAGHNLAASPPYPLRSLVGSSARPTALSAVSSRPRRHRAPLHADASESADARTLRSAPAVRWSAPPGRGDESDFHHSARSATFGRTVMRRWFARCR